MNPEELIARRAPWPVVNMDNIGDSYGPGDRIRVRVKNDVPGHQVYYNFARRREGDVFDLIPMYVTETDKDGNVIREKGQPKKRLLTAAEQFSDRTMELVEDDEPKKMTTAQQAINKEQDKINESKQVRRG